MAPLFEKSNNNKGPYFDIILKKSQTGYPPTKVLCEWQKEIPELPTTEAEDILGYQ